MPRKKSSHKTPPDQTPLPVSQPGEEMVNLPSVAISDDDVLLPGESVITFEQLNESMVQYTKTKVPQRKDYRVLEQVNAIRIETFTRRLRDGSLVRITRNIENGEQTIEQVQNNSTQPSDLD